MSYNLKRKGNPTVVQWFGKAQELLPGEELYIPCTSQSTQTTMKFSLYQERKKYEQVDPEEACKMTFSPHYANNQYFVKCVKQAMSNAVGYKKGPDGVVSPVNIIAFDPERDRALSLMIDEGFNRKQIEKELGELTDEEIKKYFGSEKKGTDNKDQRSNKES
jgi:hypothetical protein